MLKKNLFSCPFFVCVPVGRASECPQNIKREREREQNIYTRIGRTHVATRARRESHRHRESGVAGGAYGLEKVGEGVNVCDLGWGRTKVVTSSGCTLSSLSALLCSPTPRHYCPTFLAYSQHIYTPKTQWGLSIKTIVIIKNFKIWIILIPSVLYIGLANSILKRSTCALREEHK